MTDAEADNEYLLKTCTKYCDNLYNDSITPNNSLINLNANENNKDFLLMSEVENVI